LIAASPEVKTAVVTPSGQNPPHAPRRSGIDAGDLAAALAWWREAGVDQDFTSESSSWLAKREEDSPAPPVIAAAPPPAPVALPPERLAATPGDLPADLAGFVNWWLGEPRLDGGQTAGRVAPRGKTGAALMVLVDHPEAQDSKNLLSGPQGTMLAAILQAAGYGEDEVYLASALPRHMPMPDWAALGAAGLGDILAHHVALVAPQRLLVFDPLVSSLLDHDPAKSAEPLRQFYQGEARIPGLVAPGLASLSAWPRGKARFWRALLDWQAA